MANMGENMDKVNLLREHESAQNEYEENFQKLVDSVGTPSHIKYVKSERVLDKKVIDIAKSLGIHTPDPCPLTRGHKICRKCSGVHTKTSRLTKKGQKEKIVVEVKDEKVFSSSFQCGMKTTLRK